ncbi:MAG: hypothetical protein QXU46_05045 [Candidatus Bathyarchaeia archaeon]
MSVFGYCPLAGLAKDSVLCGRQKILVVYLRAFSEALLVEGRKRVRFEEKTNVSPDVWQRLPFWIKELLKMLKDSGS